VIVPDFDYHSKNEAALEIPLAERIAAIRARKAEDRLRAKANAERRAAHQAQQGRPGHGRGRDRRPERGPSRRGTPSARARTAPETPVVNLFPGFAS